MNEQNLRVGQTEIFVNIETKKMTYFSKEVKAAIASGMGPPHKP